MIGLRAERGPEAAQQAMQRRFDAANLRVQIKTAQHRLEALGGFERDLQDLTGQLRPLIQSCNGGHWPPEDPLARPRIVTADLLRLHLRSRIASAFYPYVADPLAKLLTTSLQVQDLRLYELVGEVVEDSGRVISSNRFEAVVAESDSIIAGCRYDLLEEIRLHTTMLEEANQLGAEAERAVQEERAHDLAKVRASVTPTFRAWVEQRRQSWPWKYLWPFVEKPLRNLLWPVLAGAAVAAWHWVRVRL
jgi:hypothetical protein